MRAALTYELLLIDYLYSPIYQRAIIASFLLGTYFGLLAFELYALCTESRHNKAVFLFRPAFTGGEAVFLLKAYI